MSTSFAERLKIDVYPPERQGTGAFDGGRITEIKPIGFPGDGSAVPRVGPLFIGRGLRPTSRRRLRFTRTAPLRS